MSHPTRRSTMRRSACRRGSPPAWLLLAAAFLTFAVGAACMHSYTVFLIAFIEAFGWTRAESSIAYSVSQMVSGATSPLVGILVDRLGPQRMVLIGGALLAVGLLASAYAHALWQVILLYGVVMTLGANCLGPGGVRSGAVAAVRAQPRHGGGDRAVGQRLRARVLRAGVATADRRAGLARRLSGAGRVHGGGVPAAGVAVPAHRHGPCGELGGARSAGDGWTLRQAMRTPHFWLLSLVYVFTGLGSFLVALHQLAFAVTMGFDKLYAAEVLGLGAFLSLPGVILTGWMSDYIGRELSAVVTYGTSIIGVACAMFITGPDQHLLLWLHACFFGLTWGARGPAITAKTADLFPGPRSRHDPGRDHHRHRDRLGVGVVAGGVDL